MPVFYDRYPVVSVVVEKYRAKIQMSQENWTPEEGKKFSKLLLIWFKGCKLSHCSDC